MDGEVTVIHGAAKGADSIAGEVAAELGFTVIACPPDWKRYGRAAGLVCNKQMLQEYQPQLVLAFVVDWSKSPGTRQMVGLTRKARVPTRVFDENGPVDAATPHD